MDKKLITLIILSVGLIWAKSSYGKFTSGSFVSSLDQTLTKILDKNPYPWFKQFLVGAVIPNSQVFGSLVFWGEFLTAVAIVLGSILLLLNPQAGRLTRLMLILGLAGGIFLNTIFWLGFGFTSPSSDSLNLLMIAIEIIGIVFVSSKFKTS